MVSVEGSITSNPTVDFFGYFGGALLGVCLIPQLYRTYKRKSAADVSYGWGAMYFVGLIFTLVYMILIRAWAGAIPLVVEVSRIALLFLNECSNQFRILFF